GAPVGHHAVHVLESSLAGDAGNEPGGGPGAVGAQVDGGVHVVGQVGGPALGQLQHRADALHDVHAQHGHGHLGRAAEVAGEAAAAEVLLVGTAPVGGLQAGVYVLVVHLPEGLHYMLALVVGDGAGAVQRGGAGIDEVDEAVLRHARGLVAGDP